MAWTRYSRAYVDPSRPRALGTCDRCGFIWNNERLSNQHDWRGPRLQDLNVTVCPDCYDEPQQNGQRAFRLSPDPVPIKSPNQDPYMFMGQSSSPDTSQSGSPNVIATQDLNPLVTETSSQGITTEQQTTPTPTSSGYTIP